MNTGSEEAGKHILRKVTFLLQLCFLILVLQASFHTSFYKMKTKHSKDEKELSSLHF